MRYLLQSAVLLSIAVLWTPAMAADVANGGRLATQWCGSCHVVSSGQTQASADVPPFTEIARKPGFDAARLALFLLDPHPKMPNLSLTRSEAADLAAYIKSLGAPG
jgi:mono/diheme cytochrome c family protein